MAEQYKHALRGKYTDTSPRIRGRQLQARRLRVWSANPYCAVCGRLTEFPSGFELDHKVPLFKDGEDTDENCQVLCKPLEGTTGCHDKKTAQDMGYTLRPAIGLDGWPVE